MRGLPGLRKGQGFTLIEVMIALMIFGLLAATIQQVASSYMGHYSRLENQTMATWMARNRMAEFRLADELPATGESTDDLAFGPHEWEMETVISGTPDPDMRRVDMTLYRVHEATGERLRQLVFTGYLGRN